MLPHLDDLSALVKAVAREDLLPRFAGTERQFKADGSVVTEADFAVQKRLAARLRELYPEFELLGEEMDAQRQQDLLAQSNRGLWCLDPLDGTSNFAAGLPFFGISLALLIERKPALGVIYDPIRDECFTAQRGRGAWLNGVELRVRPTDLALRHSLAVVDFKRLGPLAPKLAARPPYSSQRNLGSVALEWCWLAAGRFQVYLHGKQKLWDYAAGALILAEAGGHAETLQGEPIFSPELQPRSVVAAGDARLFADWKVWLTEHSSDTNSP
ncbi:inositol monophosphatase family protein [Methylocaldum sp.]|uniref:inositol monophosphatase family protein n=1 Tax=Methylocaldum sp. TaxID=1969727 RepID=UPI002D4494D2|nr:inositol monophosphatase family protein [Methylocaldum sp.]HYE34148.1 inositol monophosphatase family protein [Methylocaldum sp.]